MTGEKDTKDTRELLSRVLAWEDAHVGFEKAVADIPATLRGKKPDGIPYSPWQILEHLRITQHDILDFCRNPEYKEIEWPAEYWPTAAAPPSASAWDQSIREFVKDRRELQKLASDSATDLHARIPHGSGQTYARELILVADHTAYHVGQLVLVRRLLGIWQAS
jgi:uncharacterized damage-inducible protein DinB